MKWVIEFRNGRFLKDLESDNSVPLAEAKRFDSKAACVKFMDTNAWIYFNGGMAVAVPDPDLTFDSLREELDDSFKTEHEGKRLKLLNVGTDHPREYHWRFRLPDGSIVSLSMEREP